MSLGHDLSGAHDRLTEDARLFMLKELAAQVDGHLNEISLRSMLEMRYGVNRSREWVATQLHKLAELGAIEVKGDTVRIAHILPAGLDHLQERGLIVGITRPREAQ
ncbi:VpaChn25_0724 family phage protein [Pelagerythrobacter marinus]|uniref:VpaChn25_0724 family phage protein n=1 Tax=Pelagerythrobacter marinus TaxID=538382 RepID=UPI002AC9EC04|nr:hypothetical protein [Pelagerythrobacter marinus]WPZ06590.1 hypothetical protein T8T98_14430 [Pelagerythrobacter marinus]